MIIYALFFLSGIGAYFYYHKTKRKEIFTFLAILFCFLIFYPTLRWSYLFDDIDNLYKASTLRNASEVINYILSPGQGHFIPILRFLYFINFKLFWVDPMFFHILIILSFILSGFIFIKLIEELSGSFVAALFSGILIMWSTSYLQCMETYSVHLLLSLPLIFFTLYGITMYVKTNNIKWNILATLTAFLVPYVCALGVLAGLWIILFVLLCLPKENKRNLSENIKICLFPILGWLLATIIFFIKVKPMRYISEPVIYIQNAVKLTFRSLWLYDVPLVTSLEKVSLIMAAFFLIMALIRRKKIQWKVILFFSAWIIINYLFIYCGRGEFGEMLISTERFHFFSSFGLPAIYAVILSSILKDKEWESFRWKKAISFILVSLMILYACNQHTIVLGRSEGRRDLLKFGLQWRDSIGNYLKAADKDKLLFGNERVSLSPLFSKQRELEWYASFLLTPELKKKIIWSSKTDKGFIDYVESQKDRYQELLLVLKTGGYLK